MFWFNFKNVFLHKFKFHADGQQIKGFLLAYKTSKLKSHQKKTQDTIEVR